MILKIVGAIKEPFKRMCLSLAQPQILSSFPVQDSPARCVQEDGKSNQLTTCKAYEVLTLAVHGLWLFTGFCVFF